jgi:acetyltransferase-like isoleucine patch superfamily enzyme
MKGRVVLYNAKFGMIRIGKYGVGTLDIKYNRTIWQNNGTVIFNGCANIGSGTKISVNNGGIVNFGDKFCVTGASTIICSKQIEFGNECLLSWDILIMDTDFHKIINTEGKTINESKPIKIGNHVWIGCRNTILKGVNICNDVVIAAGSKISKNIVTPYCIVGGENQKILKENVLWSV